ncbi:unnamed protein product [Merluccius merluccius]
MCPKQDPMCPHSPPSPGAMPSSDGEPPATHPELPYPTCPVPFSQALTYDPRVPCLGCSSTGQRGDEFILPISSTSRLSLRNITIF